jgi:ubiquinone/menaquinone biosynthesis C-methylase UbiE
VHDFNRDEIAEIFNRYGDAEWNRHELSAASRVSFHVHRHYLDRFIARNSRVLEVGAGAGRYTVELARRGARITVADISVGQLRLNEQHLAEAGLEHAIERREVADVLDLSMFGDDGFATTVCYGGPLSWALGAADDALDELLRVTQPGGYVLLSVMSRIGSLQAFLPAVAEEIERFGVEEMQQILETGYLPDNHSTLGPMHLFTWADLRSLLERHPCELVVASAANFLSIGNEETCERWRLEDTPMWERFLAWEVMTCVEPGAIDGGTHIIVVVRTAH